MTKNLDDRHVPELPADVATYVIEKLGERGHKANACLRTAAVLMTQALIDENEADLRLAESAAYNIRETLDAVVASRPPADRVRQKVVPAWERFHLARHQPDTERDRAWAELEEALSRAASEDGRLSRREIQLLDYLRDQSGVEPLPGDHSPIVEYKRLVAAANDALHDSCVAADAMVLYEDTISWVLRMFTPPDDRVRAITALADQPYQDDSQIRELQRLVTDPHHVRLFLRRITDPAWLSPLYDAGFMRLPRPGEPWPVLGLVDGLGSIRPGDVAAILERLVGEVAELDHQKRPSVAFEILRASSHLGTAAYPVTECVLGKYPTNRLIQIIAVSVAKDADPTDPVVDRVADLVLGNESRHDGDESRALLEQLETGLHGDSVTKRVRMVAAKVCRLARDSRLRIVGLDATALTAPLGDEREPVVVLAHYLVRLMVRARSLGVATATLLDWVRTIPDPHGERIRCQVLTGADDIPVTTKIDHVVQRLQSESVTGDDQSLVMDILSQDPTREQLEPWREALGEPSAAPDGELDAATVPRDWVRSWQWSMLLPGDLLDRWQEQIARVTTLAGGEPSEDALTTRSARVRVRSGQSPIPAAELVSLTVSEAAALISAWRPNPRDGWELRSARELARTLEAVVGENLGPWTEDPTAVVTELREPVYVLHYFRAVAAKAARVADRAPAILAAARLVRGARWEPAPLGDESFHFEPDWTGVDITIVDLVAALSNTDAPLSDHLDEAWDWAGALVREAPRDRELPDGDTARDPLNSAINQPWGRGLEAVLALARWERRNRNTVRTACTGVLSDVLAIGGFTELEFRAILAAWRPLLEAVVPEWLDAHADLLFRTGELGQPTFDLTIKWSQPTRWFLTRYQDELIAAVKRRAERAATWLLVGVLNQETGYASAGLLSRLRGDEAALAAVAEASASLVQDCAAEDAQLATAIGLWRTLLDGHPVDVPPTALEELGRWAFVANIDDDTWGELMARTLQLTRGVTSYAIEVAERSGNASGCRHAGEILQLLLGRGEPWERSRIGDIAIEVLRTAATRQLGSDFYRLRSRLIEVGRPAAADVPPPGSNA